MAFSPAGSIPPHPLTQIRDSLRIIEETARDELQLPVVNAIRQQLRVVRDVINASENDLLAFEATEEFTILMAEASTFYITPAELAELAEHASTASADDDDVDEVVEDNGEDDTEEDDEEEDDEEDSEADEDMIDANVRAIERQELDAMVDDQGHFLFPPAYDDHNFDDGLNDIPDLPDLSDFSDSAFMNSSSQMQYQISTAPPPQHHYHQVYHHQVADPPAPAPSAAPAAIARPAPKKPKIKRVQPNPCSACQRRNCNCYKKQRHGCSACKNYGTTCSFF